MTVSSTTSVVRSTANGTDVEFSFNFLLLATTDMQVRVASALLNPNDYTVEIDPDDDGGTVTFDTAPAAGAMVELSRIMEITQLTEYPEAGPFRPASHERALDRLTLICQQMNQAVVDGTSAFTWKDTWTTATNYTVKDLVEGPDQNWYYCNQTHLAGVFSSDLAAGLWVLLVNRAALLSAVTDAETAATEAEAASLAAQIAQAEAEAAAENIVEAWEDSPASYDYPDIVAGSNGYTYRCVGTAVVGVDPVSDDGTNWVNISSGSSLVASLICSSATDAIKNYLHILAGDCTLTLPLSPSAGDSLAVSNLSGATTCIIARNGSKINGLAENMTVDILNASFQLFYSGATYGWVTI
jgi:hypothetical protein